MCRRYSVVLSCQLPYTHSNKEFECTKDAEWPKSPRQSTFALDRQGKLRASASVLIMRRETGPFNAEDTVLTLSLSDSRAFPSVLGKWHSLMQRLVRVNGFHRASLCRCSSIFRLQRVHRHFLWHEMWRWAFFFFFSTPHSPGNPQFDPVHSSSAGVPEGPASLSFFRLLPWKPPEEEPVVGYAYLTFVWPPLGLGDIHSFVCFSFLLRITHLRLRTITSPVCLHSPWFVSVCACTRSRFSQKSDRGQIKQEESISFYFIHKADSSRPICHHCTCKRRRRTPTAE